MEIDRSVIEISKILKVRGGNFSRFFLYFGDFGIEEPYLDGWTIYEINCADKDYNKQAHIWAKKIVEITPYYAVEIPQETGETKWLIAAQQIVNLFCDRHKKHYLKPKIYDLLVFVYITRELERKFS